MNKSDKKRIAFIYEGVEFEEKLLANMQDNYLSEFSDIDIFSVPADGNIYMLWKRLVEDEFETNLIDILKEMSSEARLRLENKGLKASHFSEIYLFFDYDGHASQFSERTLEEANQLCIAKGMGVIENKRDLLERMLLIFDNETDNGKLYVSYPMVESIKEIDLKRQEYERLFINLEDTPNYKHSFGRPSAYSNYSNLTKEMWRVACLASIRQANLILRDHEQSTYEQFVNESTQIDIYHAQKDKYINNKNGFFLAVLNSIPLFLVEYFDERYWDYWWTPCACI